jgi:hypothetical protein
MEEMHVVEYVWNRALTDEEHAALARDPFQMMRRDFDVPWYKRAWRRARAWLTWRWNA